MVNESDATGGGRGEDGDGRAPAGRMVYHLFASEERRRIASIFLDNHVVAFSPEAIASATRMDERAAATALAALEAAGVLTSMTPNEAYQTAASDDPDLERVAGDLEGDSEFYRLDKDSEVAMALAKVDSAAAPNATAFFRAAPDIDHE
ncbi:hypothetical protein BRD00_12245 [Halobacteriales archaeon QS_8_69_26]|nr:MAG: hypothetical protein BRD00_12245 [Halobacteriales archaeon QS_8_69_26]